MAGRVEHRRDKSLGKSQSRTRDSSQGSGLMQPSALRSGKYDTSNSKLNELKFDLSEIHDIYGYDATLYYVLSVKRNATASEIKAAYLSKGREILLSGRNPSQPGSDIPDSSRKQFQAISLAYEILSKEDLRALYDGRCSVARRNSVQWSKVVQEKVIQDAHPNEHSHRRYSKRAPPVYEDDACTGLDDEFDELMYYCNNNGGVNFIEFSELQGLVDTLNTSMKMKKMHLLESFDTTCLETERQPSEEAATSEEEDQRQPPAGVEDTRVIQAQNEDTLNFVCDAAEDTIFPVKGDLSQMVDEMELESSTIAIAAAAAAAATALVEAEAEQAEVADVSSSGCFTCGELDLFHYDDDDDMSRCSEIQKRASSEDAANKTRNSEPEEKSVNKKARPAMNLRKANATRMKSNEILDTDTEDKKPSAEVATSAAAVTSAGWFACCGALEAFENDDGEITVKTVDNVKDNEEKKPVEVTPVEVRAEGTALEASSTAAEEKTINSKGRPAMNLRKAMASRMKTKSLLDTDTEDKKPSAEVATTAAAVSSAGWFACCGASEAFANDDVVDDGEVTVKTVDKAKDNEEKKPVEVTPVEVRAEGTALEASNTAAEEKIINSKARPTMTLRKAMASRMKTKSLLDTDTEEKKLSAEIDNEEKKPAEQVRAEGRPALEASSTAAEEKIINSKGRPAINLRKAMASRMKTKSLPDTDTEDKKPSAEVATTAAAVSSAGWFACCGASEAFANDDADGEVTVKTVDNVKDNEEKKPLVEATSAALVEERAAGEDGSGGEAETNTANSKTNPSRKLIRPISNFAKSSNMKKKPSEEISKAQQDPLQEEDDFARSSFFCCCGASESIPDRAEEKGTTKAEEKMPSAKAEAKTPNRMSSSAKKLRNQLTIRKMSATPLLDTTEDESKNEVPVVGTEFITSNEDKKPPRKNIKISLKKKSFKRS